ncbi:MAG: tetratricopeptide repeat protein [Magnetococcales bacterium]|nr:tetratricopeptide repeat protein [Magnetococcales bacterium]
MSDSDVFNRLQSALTAYQRQEYERSWNDCHQALTLDANRPDGWTLAGMILRRLNRIPEANEAYRKAIALQPDFADPYNNFANLLREQGQFEEAVLYYRQAALLKPDFADAFNNLGGALQDVCRVDEAIVSFNRALDLRPDNADAHWDRALALLLSGDYERGWVDYEWRWRRGEPPPRPFREPAWDGSDLNGRTILIHAEQGLGDTLQFVRYVPWVAASGGRVVLEVREPLMKLLHTMPGVSQLVMQNTPLPAFDCHIPLLSLAYIFNTTVTTIPNQVPYIPVDAELVDYWGKQLRQNSRALRVGLVWGGNPRVKNDRWRSPRLQPLLELLTVAGVDFYILQHGDGRRDLEQLTLPDHVTDSAAEVRDLSDTAALMMQMDLVISSDTATAHLAGALGVPGWILLQFSPDWRWLLDRSDSPWYPSLRLFRQPQPRRWDRVVVEVRQALQQRVAEFQSDPDRWIRQRGRTVAVESIIAGEVASIRPVVRTVIAGGVAPTTAIPQQAYDLLTQGLSAYGQSDYTTAQQLCRQVLDLAPSMPEAWTVQGMLHRRAGRAADAVAAYKQAIGINPGYVDAYANMVNALRDLRDFDQAEYTYRLALSLRPDWPEILNGFADLLREMGRFDESVAYCRRALELKPDYADAWNHLGNALKQMGQQQQAIDCYRKALTLKPAYAEAHYNLGIALHDSERYQESIPCYQQAVALSPRFHQAWYNLGVAWQKSGNADQALSAYRQTIALEPGHQGAHFNLGATLNWVGRVEEALISYRQALRLSPDGINIAVEIFHIEQKLCHWQSFATLRQRLVEPAIACTEGGLGIPPSPFPFLSMPVAITEEEQLRIARCHSHYLHKTIQPLPQDYPTRRVNSGSRRLRVGYLSADFHNHATAHLMLGHFKRHDRSRFEVFAYSLGPDDGSFYRQRITSEVDHFVDLRSMTMLGAAQRIQQDGIDLLIDLKGYTRDSRPEILAYRPAPVQAAYLGYPGSMGADFIDAILTDRWVTPPEQQLYYSEKLVYLPHSYQVNDSGQQIASETANRLGHGLPEQGFVFCCFNSHYKIDQRIFAVWMDLLRTLPDSVLWLFDGYPTGKENLRREAAERGVDPQRLVFAPSMPKEQHLARHRWADLFLDTLYYNAHTTASDALWAGVPVLTCPGHTFASRVSVSLLQAIGLQDEGLIVADLDQYRQRALQLATHPDQLAAIRQKLQRNRLTHPLFDTDLFVRDFEAALEQMWRDWLGRD